MSRLAAALLAVVAATQFGFLDAVWSVHTSNPGNCYQLTTVAGLWTAGPTAPVCVTV